MAVEFEHEISAGQNIINKATWTEKTISKLYRQMLTLGKNIMLN